MRILRFFALPAVALLAGLVFAPGAPQLYINGNASFTISLKDEVADAN